MSFPHSKRGDVFAPTAQTPGPTDYEVNVSLVSDDKHKKYGFIGTTKRFKSPKAGSPQKEGEISPTVPVSNALPPHPPAMSRQSTRQTMDIGAGPMNRQASRQPNEALKYKKEAEKWQEQYDRQLLNHQRDMHHLEDRLSRLDVALREALREKNALASSAVAKEKELQELNHRHALLKSSLEKSDKSSLTLVEKAKSSSVLERKITDLEKTTAKTRSLVDAKTTTLEKLQFERNELRDQCDTLSKQVWEMVDEKVRRDAEVITLEAQRGALASRVMELEGVVAEAGGATAERERELLDRIAEMVEHSEKLSRNKLETEAKLESISFALEAARSEMDADKAKLALLEEEILSHSSLIAAMETDKAEWLANRCSMEAHAKEMLKKLETASVALTTLDSQKHSLEKLVNTMEAKNAEITGILAKLQVSVEERSQQVATLEELRRTEHAEYEDVIESLKAAILRHQTEVEQERNLTNSQLNELHAHLETGMHEILRRDQQLQAMAAAEEDLRVQLASVKAELVATAEVSEAFRSHFDEINNVKAQLADRLALIEEELLITSNELSSTKTELDSSYTRIHLLESDIRQLNIALDEASAALATANANHGDDLAIHESRMNELQEQLEEERRYRAGERDMTELRIASIQASSLDSMQQKTDTIAEMEQYIESLKEQIYAKAEELTEVEKAHRSEIGQVKLELAEQTEMVNEYRERAYDNESTAEELQNRIAELEKKGKTRVAAHAHEMKEMENAFKTIIEEFRGKIDTLEAVKATVAEELVKAKEDVASNQSRLGCADDHIKALTDKHSELEGRIEVLVKSLEDSQCTVGNLESELRVANRRISVSSQESSAKSESICALEAELKAARQELELASVESINLKQQLDSQTSSLNAVIAELNARAASMEKSLAEQHDLSMELRRELDAKAAEYEQAVATHRQEVLDLTSQLNNTQSSLSQLQAAMESLSVEHSDASARNKQLTESIAQEVARHSETKLHAVSLDSDLALERSAKNKLATKVSQLELFLASETESARTLQSQIDDLHKMKNDNEDQIQRLKGELESQRSAFEKLQVEAAAALETERASVFAERRRSQDLSTSLGSQMEAVLTLTIELDAVKRELESEVANSSEKDVKVDSLLADLESQRAKVQDLFHLGDELERHLQSERDAHAVSQQLATELTATLNEERRRNLELTKGLQANLEDVKVQLERSNSRILELEANLANEVSVHAAHTKESEEKHAEYLEYHSKAKSNLALLAAALQSEQDLCKNKDERISHLSAELAQRTAELEGGRMELEALRTRSMSAMEANETERASHRETVNELQSRSERLGKTVAEKDTVIKDLQTEVAAVKVRNANEIGRRDDEIRALTEKLKEMELAFVSMKSVVETAGQHREELNNARALFQDTMQKADQEHQKYTETLKQSSVELDGVKTENQRLEIALAKAEARQVEVEETLSAQVTFLSQNYKAAFDDIKKLSTANADLMGHQNAQQKIHHIAKLKEELVKLKQENASITRERDALKRRNLIIERDLEAFKAVVPKVAPHSLTADFKFLHETTDASKLGTSVANAEPMPRGPKKMSRIGRTVLAARAKQQDIEKMGTKPQSFLVAGDVAGDDAENDETSVAQSPAATAAENDQENSSNASFFIPA